MWLTILFGVLWLFTLALYWQGHTIRRRILDYTVFLLLSDEIHADHKRKFRDFIMGLNASTAMAAYSPVSHAVERMAQQIASESPMYAYALVWKIAQESSSRDSVEA